MTKDEEALIKRISELARVAYERSVVTHTDFLNLNELSIFEYAKREFSYIKHELYGGYYEAERCIIIFMPEYVSCESISQISCIKATPLSAKFSDELSHRDYLGAVLNLGIDRGKVGDIIIHNNIGYILCMTSISKFISDNLIKIKHTNVSCTIKESLDVDILPKFKTITGTVSSNRLDAIVSLALSKSRNNVAQLISGGKVFVNGKLTESNHYLLKEKDIITVRGQGKFIYYEVGNKTRKGRYGVTLQRYV